MKLKIKQNMSSHPVVAKCDEDIKSAYLRMKAIGARHLPVLDADDNLAGIISDRDFQRAIDRNSPVGSNMPNFKSNELVSGYMSWPVKTLSHVNDLLTAVRMMIDEKISAIVITENNEMIGILTHEDLLRVLESLLKKPETLKDKMVSLAYNSPLGVVVETLATIGV